MSTTYELVSIENLNRIRSSNDVKSKYKIRCLENNTEYIVLHWPGIKNMIVYDAHIDTTLNQYNWYCLPVQYAGAHDANGNLVYMHVTVWYDVYNNQQQSGHSIDHINRIKTDNRIANLRLATQSAQNSNRNVRSDKQKPCQELLDLGVTELPRYVRWDKTELKFVIEKHPKLLQDTNDGKRKKAIISGSKSSKLSVVEKFQDILAKLEALETIDDFDSMRLKLEREYHDICNPVRAFLGLPLVHHKTEEPSGIQAKQMTIPGRKKLDPGLPLDCGVTIDMIPKYCYYRQACDKRGDMFVIERHPTLIANNKKQWRTSGSKSISTAEKFAAVMGIYNMLQSGQMPK